MHRIFLKWSNVNSFWKILELLQTRQIGLLLGLQTRGFLFYIYISTAPPSENTTGRHELLLSALLPFKLFYGLLFCATELVKLLWKFSVDFIYATLENRLMVELWWILISQINQNNTVLSRFFPDDKDVSDLLDGKL